MSEEKTDSSLLTPGGVWTDRKPSFRRTLGSLFRRSMLLKIRDMGVIASEFIATFLVVILIVFWNFSDNPSDPITKTEILSSDELFGNAVLKYNMVVELGKGGNLIIGPNSSPLLHQLINSTWGAALIPLIDFDKLKETGNLQKSIKDWVNVSEKYHWLDNKDEIKESIKESDSFTTGIW
ncbi:hypothetical protein TVAG_245210 [Trichomonas vaginalis G3]|uniref:Uncharacterized protein n=1 Tax=Trichomonas vaginalis (strain ATCC PRA-98 / G3) TaxID=412133 RepID=A2FPE4_TRIV3|nr:ATPase activity, coupled to transmembrane movement of substances [Trichomonas vaginalis G3]EAX93217.1 hypothetical protein TVAG_245210 [Trichomonas vaginalis G3]KAI5539471.1 ATPase activity, coupled to transmembrane movement of substances [Trichomonas vaginalis G3]|eukprot:XP_001306147.1 hypothetical protein [Trichomonas vaginalis G3]